jgi:uncharacterized coiled-coil protein SlyX
MADKTLRERFEELEERITDLERQNAAMERLNAAMEARLAATEYARARILKGYKLLLSRSCKRDYLKLRPLYCS